MGYDWSDDDTVMYVPPTPATPVVSNTVPGALVPTDQQPNEGWTAQQLIGGWNLQQSMWIQSLLDYHGYLPEGYHKGMWYDTGEGTGTIDALEDAMDASRQERMEFMRFLLTGAPAKLVSGAGGSAGAAGPDLSPTTNTATTTSTSTNKQINLTSRAGARQVLASVLATELGREPSSKEVSLFLKNLNRRERNNPSVSKTSGTTVTTTTTDPQKDGDSTTTTDTDTDSTTTTKQANVDPTRMSEKFAKQQNPEEWRMFQNAQYYDVLAQMLGM